MFMISTRIAAAAAFSLAVDKVLSNSCIIRGLPILLARLKMTSSKSAGKDPRLTEVVNIYRKNAELALPSNGEIRVCSKTIKVTTKWTLNDMDMEKRISFDTIAVAARSDENLEFKLIQPAKELNESIIFVLNTTSKSQLRAVAKEVQKGEKKTEFVEIWKGATRLGVYDADFAGLHGKIITKGHLPSFEWSADESKLLFVAEKKVPTPESFFAKKPSAESNIGALYEWKEDWGEQTDGTISPVIVVLDIHKMEAEVIENPLASLGQAVFTADGKGIVGVELPNIPYRLGSIFCKNRLQQLFHYEFETKRFTMLTAKDKYAFSPRFDPSGKTLIFFQNEVGGPHAMGSTLCKIDWTSEKKAPVTVVGVSAAPRVKDFPGIYEANLIRDCILADCKTVFFPSTWHSKRVILKVDLENGNVTNVTPDEKFGAWELFSIHNGYLLASRSSPSIKTHVVVGKVTSDCVEWLPVHGIVEESDIKWQLIMLHPEDDDQYYTEAIHIYKKPGEKRPLIVFPHGGPHATSIARYSREVQYLIDCGYTVLFVNYRGSLGFGDLNLRSLPGRVGSADVKDVWQAALAAEKSGLVSEFLLFGGSHGGFLVGHLAGQYPKMFKACCLLNPVIDLSMMGPSDIPDWYWFEGGCKGDFTHKSLPTSDDLAQMLAKSPIAHASKIEAPCHFFLGSNDLRVDKGQGIKLYKHLLARQIDTKCNMYDDNHSLGKLKHDSDMMITAIQWFDKYARK